MRLHFQQWKWNIIIALRQQDSYTESLLHLGSLLGMTLIFCFVEWVVELDIDLCQFEGVVDPVRDFLLLAVYVIEESSK